MKNNHSLRFIKVSLFEAVKTFFIISLAVIFFQACLQTKTHADGTKVFRTGDRKTISYQQMIDDLKKVNIVFVGEVHNQEAHHRLQLDVIKALNNAKIPVAVGLEMFIVKNQNILDQWVAGTISSDAFIKAYYENWDFPWPLYRDIFLYVREYKIPAVGLNISPEITRKVAASGFASLSKEELAKLPPETGCAVSEQYMKFIRRAYSMHGHNNKNFLFFCEAQLIWDQVMARNTLEFLKNNPDKKVIVLTGNGHAWKRGIPEQIRVLSEKTSYRVVLPHIPGRIDPRDITSQDADYILLQ
jgi:uncharacterized iron-regulated protein